MLSLELHTQAFPRATEVDWIYMSVKAILWDSVRAGEKKQILYFSSSEQLEQRRLPLLAHALGLCLPLSSLLLLFLSLCTDDLLRREVKMLIF